MRSPSNVAISHAAQKVNRQSDALNDHDDRRIADIKPLIPPQIIMEDYPLSVEAAETVALARREAEAVIHGEDDRLLVIVGPCSIHDTLAAKEYAAKLLAYKQQSSDDLVIIMRVYFEKPRTTVGWKGLINDPALNNSYAINRGLTIARGLLLDLSAMGVPCGCEFLDMITPQYVGDLVTWGAIGARTTESQVHRELASGLSVPVGFKNGTDGSTTVAIDALRSASSPHHFLSVTKQGLSAIVKTTGNDACHVILRGGAKGPNYDAASVADCVNRVRAVQRAGEDVNSGVMIDCSHGNSSKDHRRQPLVADAIVAQLAAPVPAAEDAPTAAVTPAGTAPHIIGVMLESHLVEGKQAIPDDPARLDQLVYGQSVTDACISWEQTVKVLDRLREGVRTRRANRAAAAAPSSS
ncbi:hypothetical protein CXG81DRAFT_11525 [Caulochytrium protostelioides]|uniref:3-deoxy-7-phosphoheptulonate synthase n=1 Tax=Caulochytrium protostelioides TaxID=1555241 RepID=A0A4P9X961_9FUNG|nr:hypothetical protein CXG81DRAFT_11525 [Caulochytrium protostelioides]|eukprot:RKP01828.1 hypothetical protein CXG81DRAFT_11525 [Caulochytrium protostelioides]